MCQIHFIYNKTSKLNKLDLEQFYRLMCLGSKDNDDAYGIFNSKLIYKDNGLFNTTNLDENLLKDKFIVGHNRLSTSREVINPFLIGCWINNPDISQHHPFRVDDFVLCHNGVITNSAYLRSKYGLNSNIITDSYTILLLINKFFKSSIKTDRLDKLTESIQTTTKLLEGSFSIILYDKLSDNLIYFKNFKTEFAIFETNDKLIGSTDIQNLYYVYMNELKSFININSDTIYLISDKIKKIGTFKDKTFFSKSIATPEQLLTSKLGYIPEYSLKGDYIILKKDKIDISILKKDKSVIIGKKLIKILYLKGGKKKNGIRMFWNWLLP